ncbi:MAG: matrixin family metalloprotease, partial [Candidatus Obscuribacterales bacterium]|nr:matrixin family metalloprotease [Candidatus Obscuribacterales bacterium]
GAQHVDKNFHWNKKTVRVYVQPANGVRGFAPTYNDVLQESFLSWSQTGDLSFEFVDSVAKADIECVWTDDVSKLSSPGEGGEAILRHQGNVVTHARVTLLTARVGTRAALTEREVRALCLHEIGHALGLSGHTNNPEDIMFYSTTFKDAWRELSGRDSRSITRLYQSDI